MGPFAWRHQLSNSDITKESWDFILKNSFEICWLQETSPCE